jgi:hypothetical protein
VLADMLKLALVTSILRRSYPDLKVESYLTFADSRAASVVGGKRWASVAAKEFVMHRVFTPVGRSRG